MVKEIERYGIPVVHMSTIITISESVGANRIVPTIAIPHPVGNPKISSKDEDVLRHDLVNRAVNALGTDVEEQSFF